MIKLMDMLYTIGSCDCVDIKFVSRKNNFSVVYFVESGICTNIKSEDDLFLPLYSLCRYCDICDSINASYDELMQLNVIGIGINKCNHLELTIML